jgi:hypothetical protein
MYHINQEWWYMPIMSALGKWRQEVRGSRYLLLHSKFEASSGYLRLYQKKKKKNPKGKMVNNMEKKRIFCLKR